jgi:hypothetical protein
MIMTTTNIRKIAKLTKRHSKLVKIINEEKMVIFEKKGVTLQLGKLPKYSFNEEGA